MQCRRHFHLVQFVSSFACVDGVEVIVVAGGSGTEGSTQQTVKANYEWKTCDGSSILASLRTLCVSRVEPSWASSRTSRRVDGHVALTVLSNGPSANILQQHSEEPNIPAAGSEVKVAPRRQERRDVSTLYQLLNGCTRFCLPQHRAVWTSSRVHSNHVHGCLWPVHWSLNSIALFG
jgi:hypothetical protein